MKITNSQNFVQLPIDSILRLLRTVAKWHRNKTDKPIKWSVPTIRNCLPALQVDHLQANKRNTTQLAQTQCKLHTIRLLQSIRNLCMRTRCVTTDGVCVCVFSVGSISKRIDVNLYGCCVVHKHTNSPRLRRLRPESRPLHILFRIMCARVSFVVRSFPIRNMCAQFGDCIGGRLLYIYTNIFICICLLSKCGGYGARQLLQNAIKHLLLVLFGPNAKSQLSRPAGKGRENCCRIEANINLFGLIVFFSFLLHTHKHTISISAVLLAKRKQILNTRQSLSKAVLPTATKIYEIKKPFGAGKTTSAENYCSNQTRLLYF